MFVIIYGFCYLDVGFYYLDVGFYYLDVGFYYLDVGFYYLDVADLSKGDIVMWPSNFLWPHGVTEATKGTRYSAVCWAW